MQMRAYGNPGHAYFSDQISLIDLLVEIRERRSLEALRGLIKDQTVNGAVREHAEKRMKELI